MRVPAILLALLVGACAAKPPAPDCTAVQVKAYSDEYEKRLVHEIIVAPPDSAMAHAVADYRAMRDSVAACQHLDAGK